jgi:phospholipid-binding lipoprotein MlaA
MPLIYLLLDSKVVEAEQNESTRHAALQDASLFKVTVRKEKTGMRNFIWILIIFALWVGIVPVPCFADEFSPSRSLQLKENFFVSNQPHSNSSDVTLPEGALIERDIIDQTEVLLYSEAREPQSAIPSKAEEEDFEYLEEEEEDEIADPFEPLNRVAFYFNDKLYFWVIKPVAKGYSAVLPEDVRIAIRNVFNNITTPARVVNNLLQFKVKSVGNELLRFGINSTVGVLGVFDIAEEKLNIKMQDEDLGQTLGVWGLGAGFYINWPILGPSSARDTIGLAGDYFLDPISYVTPTFDSIAIRAGDLVNRTSLTIGQYEDIKKDALDPYTAFKDIYYQYRKNKISK